MKPASRSPAMGKKPQPGIEPVYYENGRFVHYIPHKKTFFIFNSINNSLNILISCILPELFCKCLGIKVIAIE